MPLLAPTEALIVMMCYYMHIYMSTRFFRFSLSQMMLLMFQESLSVAETVSIYLMSNIECGMLNVGSRMSNVECRMMNVNC